MPSGRGGFVRAGALVWSALAVLGCPGGGSKPSPVDTVPPTVLSTWPAAGATDLSPEGAVVTAMFAEDMDPATVNGTTVVVRDPSGVSVMGTVLYVPTSATFTPSGPLAWLTTYTATVTTGVKDLAGNPLSAPVSWSFTTAPPPDLIRPLVVSYEPAAGAVAVPPDATVRVTFSEPMEAASTEAAISLAGPSGAVPASVSVSGGVATLTPASRLADLTLYTATVTTAARDLHGNPLDAGASWSFTTADATPPLILSVHPPAGVSNVDVGVWVSLVFDDQMDGATVDASSFQVRAPGGAPLAGRVDFGGNASTFFPAAPLAPDTTYTVTASTGMTDLAGNPLAAPFASTFTTTGAGAGSWTAMAAPSPLEPYAARADPSAVWTGSALVVWGGWYLGPMYQVHVLANGGRYAPASDAWEVIPSSLPGTPAGRFGHATVWTGSRMIVWGGNEVGGLSGTGGVYDPSGPGSGSWTATGASGAPEPRANPAAAWTGSEMIVWGGWNPGGAGVYFGSGGRYAPATGSWTSMSALGAPTARVFPAAVWTGSRFLVWGGLDGAGFAGDGAAYDPVADVWEPIAAGGPSARWKAAAAWTGTRMIVWGGSDAAGVVADGAAYDPVTDTWSAVSALGAPPPRDRPSTVWTGSRMIVWGGDANDPLVTQTGGSYDPAGDAWTLTALAGAPSPRDQPAAAWTGSGLIVWGGSGSGIFKDGAVFTP